MVPPPPAARPRIPKSRRIASGLAAGLVAVTLIGTIGARPALGADLLRLAVTTTYRVDVAEAAVHVTMDVTATSLKANSATRRFWYDTLSFGVQAEARAVEATSDGKRLRVTTAPRSHHLDVVVHTPNLYYRQTHKTRITFDLPGGKPRSPSPIRVGRAYASFTAWSWGDPGLANVRIVLPTSFAGDVTKWPDDRSDPLFARSKDGQQTYSADGIEEPDGWYATVDVADRAALTDTPLELGREDVAIHAWPEDREWLDRVSTVLESGVPSLEAAIGLPWPVPGQLGVSEVSSSQIEGYGGLYDSTHDEIQISEDLDSHVIVHEAAHAWFNTGLFAQRWINEGLADEYASRVPAGLAGSSLDDPQAVSIRDVAAFRLNAWPPPSRVDDTTEATESFGYDASWTVIRAIVDDAGMDGMRAVFAAVADHTATYPGIGPAETSGLAVTDWRRFLDLVEDVGGSTRAAGLIGTWAVTDTERPQLAARADARKRYDSLLAAGGTWLPGSVVRAPMRAWRFPEAAAAMTEAATVLADRDRLTTATAELGLAFPAALEPAYESAADEADLQALDGRIAGWIRAATAVRSARDALAAARAPLVAVGLLGTRPEAAYTAALAAFAAGDDAAAVAGSSEAVAALAGAEEIGRGRALSIGAVAAAVAVLLLVLVVLWFRARRRRRQALAGATAGLDTGPASLAMVAADDDAPTVATAVTPDGAPEPYATLAATPDPREEHEIGVEPD